MEPLDQEGDQTMSANEGLVGGQEGQEAVASTDPAVVQLTALFTKFMNSQADKDLKQAEDDRKRDSMLDAIMRAWVLRGLRL